jgi:cephalosporin-C deacetylase-like acetyl esterase
MNLIRLLAAGLFALQVSVGAFADGAGTRAEFLAVIERSRVDSKPALAELAAVDGLRKYHLWFQSDATSGCPGYLLLPDPERFKGRRPVVIALHGTGGNKDNGEIAEILSKAAHAGFIGVAIDGRFHGERTKAGSGAVEYNEAIARAVQDGCRPSVLLRHLSGT